MGPVTAFRSPLPPRAMPDSRLAGRVPIAVAHLTAAALLTIVAGCGRPAAPPPVAAADAEPTLPAPPRAAESAPDFSEQELDQLASPFTERTVLRLNAVVARSLAVVDRFDRLRGAPGSGVEPLEQLAAEATAARTAMDGAEADLRRSGEPFNEAILAAMTGFVREVEQEVRQELAAARREPRGAPAAAAGP